MTKTIYLFVKKIFRTPDLLPIYGCIALLLVCVLIYRFFGQSVLIYLGLLFWFLLFGLMFGEILILGQAKEDRKNEREYGPLPKSFMGRGHHRRMAAIARIDEQRRLQGKAKQSPLKPITTRRVQSFAEIISVATARAKWWRALAAILLGINLSFDAPIAALLFIAAAAFLCIDAFLASYRSRVGLYGDNELEVMEAVRYLLASRNGSGDNGERFDRVFNDRPEQALREALADDVGGEVAR